MTRYLLIFGRVTAIDTSNIAIKSHMISQQRQRFVALLLIKESAGAFGHDADISSITFHHISAFTMSLISIAIGRTFNQVRNWNRIDHIIYASITFAEVICTIE